MNDVSVIICVRNSVSTLERCLESVVANHPREILVVDGNSTDGSYELAVLYATNILRDEGKGLSYARQIGVSAAKGKYVLHIGPDNVLPPNVLQKFIQCAERFGFHGSGAQTQVICYETIWDKLLDRWWRYVRPAPGVRNVIGTPCLFLREVLLEVPFSEKPVMCDDTELCERLTQLGYRIGLVPVIIYDASGRRMNDIISKFRGYGHSDADYFALHAPGWHWKRKMQSMLHPMRQAFRGFSWEWQQENKSLLAAFFHLFIGVCRYYGWLRIVYRRRFGGKL